MQNSEIYVMNVDGSEQTRLTNNDADDLVLPGHLDGVKIAFRKQLEMQPRSESYEIYTMNAADGSKQTRLTNNNATDTDPTWSPDGAKIAFSDRSDGNFQIYVMNSADGSE